LRIAGAPCVSESLKTDLYRPTLSFGAQATENRPSFETARSHQIFCICAKYFAQMHLRRLNARDFDRGCRNLKYFDFDATI
jgi:hypothetical protein